MIIRKKFSVESAHIVRNCTSERCSHSIHGHSAIIEVFFESYDLDNAQMVYDFGLMKGTIKQFIDSMDHCYLLCSQDSEKFKNFIKNTCDRWIELPFNPSAEMLSVYIMSNINNILSHTEMNNGEENIKVRSVRYHETQTGYAECDMYDLERFENKYDIYSINYSQGVMKDWGQDMQDIMLGMNIKNPIVKQQINLQ